jgi:hypothetical protein
VKIIAAPPEKLKREMNRIAGIGPIHPARKNNWQPGRSNDEIESVDQREKKKGFRIPIPQSVSSALSAGKK